MSKKISISKYRTRPLFNSTAPKVPGWYYWSEYKANVEVYRRRGKLYVMPPGQLSVEVAVTPRIAGTFKPTADRKV